MSTTQGGDRIKIAVGSDESTPLTEAVVRDLERRGMSVELLGALAKGDDPEWPEVGRKVAEMVARGEADQGVLFCWTGTGVSIAANKVPGVRGPVHRCCHRLRGTSVEPRQRAGHGTAPDF